jgi:hypothetical protein
VVTPHSQDKSITVERLTAILAERVLGWSVGPDRFLRGNRSWLPKWRFRPIENLNDAFALLEASRPDRYTLRAETRFGFHVQVEIAGCVGEASHSCKPRAITLAIAKAIGIHADVDEATR